VNTIEKETSVAVETMTDEGTMIVEAFDLLLDQNAHHTSMKEFSFHGPVERLYQLMLAKRPDGLPDVAGLVAWLKTPLNWKRLRDAQIILTFPPLPVRKGVTMVKLERATSPDQYTRLIDGQRV
jgi:hypothetical protein